MESLNSGTVMAIQMEGFPTLGKEIGDEEAHRSGKVELVEAKAPIVVPNPQVTKLTSASPILNRESPIDVDASKGQTWASLFSKMKAKGKTLQYVELVIVDGEKVAQIQQEKVEEDTQKWKQSIVLYVVGNSPSIGAIDRFISTTWNFSTKPKIYYHNEGYFLVLFDNMEDRDDVVYSWPHIINSRPVIIRAWTPNFCINNEVLRIIPLWIRLPNLPMNY
ncbi:hypothetical protein RND71_019222 [Anisodus tanguticus]|uniref:DUF4283 domain-containing protein n=1 Tax=Anisodus tanguticus TaxID=243964 RepID=A0AAE1RYZ9_9SOLA|nr:hypothetical protein RND71_019222 [Anisodus tanguticus]